MFYELLFSLLSLAFFTIAFYFQVFNCHSFGSIALSCLLVYFSLFISCSFLLLFSVCEFLISVLSYFS